MKNKRILIFLAAFTIIAGLRADVLDSHSALERALNRGAGVIPTRSESYNLVETLNDSTGQPAVYLFSSGSSSLVVSGDDSSPALLGWFDSEMYGDHSPEFRWWLSQYAAQIGWMRGADITVNAGTRAAEQTHQAIAPMVKTRWDQTAPYNDKCPQINGKRAYTGCVATAMAQAVNYYRVADKGKLSRRYSLKDGTEVSFDFASTTFKWSDMLDRYGSSATAAQKEAVANLMLACGVAVEMQYSSEESGAIAELIPNGLLTFLGYGKQVRNYIRNLYTQQEWDEIVYGQLRDIGPVIYSGVSEDAGHCFICDGYQAGYYHINWGWGGMDDGYFLLSALDPGIIQGAGGSTGGYNYHQLITGDMKTNASEATIAPVFSMPYGFKMSANISSTLSKLQVDGWLVSYAADVMSIKVGVIMFNQRFGTKLTYNASSNFSGISPLYGVSSYTVNVNSLLSSELNEGTYTVYPCITPYKKEAIPVPVPLGYPPYYTMVVKDKQITLTPAPVAYLWINDVSQEGTSPVDQYVAVTGNLVNNSELDYEGQVQLQLERDGKSVGSGMLQEVSLESKGKKEFRYESTLAGDSLSAGEYTAYFLDPVSEQKQSNKFTVTLTPEVRTSVKVSDLQVVGGEGGLNKERLEFTARVECVEGQLSGPVQIAIAVPVAGSSQAQVIMMNNSQPLFLSPGESGEAHFMLTMMNAEDNKTYLAAVFFNDEQQTKAIRFGFSTSGVDDTEDDKGAEKIFNLNGVCLPDNSTPGKGLFIIDGKKVLR